MPPVVIIHLNKIKNSEGKSRCSLGSSGTVCVVAELLGTRGGTETGSPGTQTADCEGGPEGSCALFPAFLPEDILPENTQSPPEWVKISHPGF